MKWIKYVNELNFTYKIVKNLGIEWKQNKIVKIYVYKFNQMELKCYSKHIRLKNNYNLSLNLLRHKILLRKSQKHNRWTYTDRHKYYIAGITKKEGRKSLATHIWNVKVTLACVT